MGEVSLAGVPLNDAPTGEGAQGFWGTSILVPVIKFRNELASIRRHVEAWSNVPGPDEWWRE